MRTATGWCWPASPSSTAYLISGGDDKYLDVWRKQADRINAQAKTVDGKLSTPRMFGDQGWYSFHPGKYEPGALEIYYLSMKPADRARAPANPWYDFLDGKNPSFPVTALRRDIARIRKQMEIVRADTTSPDMRLADSALDSEPASTTSLIELMEGGIRMARPTWAPGTPAIGGAPLHARLRYFDAERRRPGIPRDVAALIEGMTADSLTVTFVNVSPSDYRSMIVQGGAMASTRSFRCRTARPPSRSTQPGSRAACAGIGRAPDHRDEALRQCADLGSAVEGHGAVQRRRAGYEGQG